MVAAIDQMSQQHWDVTIVGAGPAGSFTAFLLAKEGLKVLLVDKNSWPRYKVCGGCLSPEAEHELRSAGLHGIIERPPATRCSSFQLGVSQKQVTLPLQQGTIIPRDALDNQLVGKATENGASFVPNTAAADYRVDNDGVTLRLQQHHETVEVRSRLLVQATGLKPLKSPTTGNGPARISQRSYLGTGVELSRGPDFYRPGIIYMAVSKHGYAGQVRYSDGRLNIAAAVHPKSMGKSQAVGSVIEQIIQESGFPVAEDLRSAPWRGTPKLTRKPAVVAEARVFRLGDAAGYIEPFTGEGIGWALRGARCLTPLVCQALESDPTAVAQQWNCVHRQQVVRKQRVCKVLSTGLRYPRLVENGVRLMRTFPTVGTGLLYLLDRSPSITLATHS